MMTFPTEPHEKTHVMHAHEDLILKLAALAQNPASMNIASMCFYRGRCGWKETGTDTFCVLEDQSRQVQINILLFSKQKELQLNNS